MSTILIAAFVFGAFVCKISYRSALARTHSSRKHFARAIILAKRVSFNDMQAYRIPSFGALEQILMVPH